MITEKQKQVLIHIAKGKTMRETANILGLKSHVTVNDQVTLLLKKGYLKKVSKTNPNERGRYISTVSYVINCIGASPNRTCYTEYLL